MKRTIQRFWWIQGDFLLLSLQWPKKPKSAHSRPCWVIGKLDRKSGDIQLQTVCSPVYQRLICYDETLIFLKDVGPEKALATSNFSRHQFLNILCRCVLVDLISSLREGAAARTFLFRQQWNSCKFGTFILHFPHCPVSFVRFELRDPG